MSDWIPDASSLAAFRENPELFRLRYRKGLRPAGQKVNAADAGRAFHAALYAWFSDWQSDLDAALAALHGAWPDEKEQDEKRPLQLYHDLLEGYAKRYPREDDPFTIIHNEQYVEHELGSLMPYKYCGIVDRVVEWEDGSRYIMDTKTTAAWLGGAYFKTFEMSPQMLGYCALMRARGEPVQGYMMDVVHVDTRYGKVKPERDFARTSNYLAPAWKIDKWQQDAEYTIKQIENLDEHVGPDQPWPFYANQKFGPDAFWEFYNMPMEMHPQLELGYEVEFWNPREVASCSSE